ncbi:hypothetical protein QC760_005649 [Botrytis cinerea]
MRGCGDSSRDSNCGRHENEALSDIVNQIPNSAKKKKRKKEIMSIAFHISDFTFGTNLPTELGTQIPIRFVQYLYARLSEWMQPKKPLNGQSDIRGLSPAATHPPPGIPLPVFCGGRIGIWVVREMFRYASDRL